MFVFMYVFFYLLLFARSKQTIIQKAEHENTIIIKSEPIINIGIPTIVVVNIV